MDLFLFFVYAHVCMSSHYYESQLFKEYNFTRLLILINRGIQFD